MPFLTDRMHETERAGRAEAALRDENAPMAPAAGAAAGAVSDAVSGGASGGGQLRTRFTFDPARIEAELRASIVGQDESLTELVQILQVVRADIGDPRKPLCTVLLCGPTGVGKTETVRTLARGLYGDADAFCRVDMNTLAQEHYAAALTGAPPGYVGSKEGTTILDQEKIEGSRGLPGLVLFDEVEKASNEVVLALMNVFDNGLLTTASGERTYSFRNALVFLSSNLGARELMQLDEGRAGLMQRLRAPNASRRERAQRIVSDALLERFPPEFVNRIDHIETFDWISREDMPALVDVELQRLNRRLGKHDLELSVREELRSFLSDCGHDKRFGARALRRAVRHHLEFPLAGFLLEQPAPAPTSHNDFKNRLIADRRDGKVWFEYS